MAGRRQHQIDAEARKNWARYQEAIQLARQWMRETDSNQRGLAERLGETEASVSKFLSGTLEHAPCTYRKAKMRMLERIEDLCTNPTTIAHYNKYVQNIAEMTDERYWALVTVEKAKEILAGPFAGRALVHLRTSFVEALHGPTPEKYYVCGNVLLHLSEFLTRLMRKNERPACSAELYRKTLARVTQLRDVSITGFRTLPEDWNPAAEEARAVGYSGLCFACIGLLLGDDAILLNGVKEMGRSVSIPHRREAWLWPNYLLFIEHLLEVGDSRALGFSAEAAVIAQRDNGPHLAWTLQTRSLSKLTAHWREAAPQALQAASR